LAPERQKLIPFSRVTCDGNERSYVQQVLDSGWLTTAGKTAEFERRFADFVGARYACAVNSCTAALHLALEALGVKPGDEILVPTMTFTADAEVIRYLGAHPIFLDVEYGTGLVTPEILEQALERHPRARVFIMTHYAGQADGMISGDEKGILEICREHEVKLVEDAAHAFPTRTCGRMVGAIGDVTCFSFYANKTITTGEGGMLTTDNPDIVARAKIMRLHGIDRDCWNRFTHGAAQWEYDVVAPGFKYNMPDLNAAVGLAQLERAEDMRLARERCARYYLNALSSIDALDLPVVRAAISDHAWHLFVICLKPEAKINRNAFIEYMAQAGVGLSVHYKPLHRMTYYRDFYKLRPEDFPQAERMWRGCVSLPIFPGLTDDELDYVCSCVSRILN
jgi:dTDP-4-amino-4,6-dideoxygalactose transaminase